MYNYNYSKVEMSIYVNDNKYILYTNLLQACILGHIIENGKITAEDLSKKMNLSLTKMCIAINSLIISKLIIRNDAINDYITNNSNNVINTDTNITFCLNENFSSSTINLINYLKIAEIMLRNLLIKKEKNNSEMEQTNSEFKASIMKIINDNNNNNNKMTKIEIIENISKNNNINSISNDKIEILLNEMIEANLLKLENEYYTICDNEQVSIDNYIIHDDKVNDVVNDVVNNNVNDENGTENKLNDVIDKIKIDVTNTTIINIIDMDDDDLEFSDITDDEFSDVTDDEFSDVTDDESCNSNDENTKSSI